MNETPVVFRWKKFEKGQINVNPTREPWSPQVKFEVSTGELGSVRGSRHD